MAERIYPSSRNPTAPGAGNGNSNPSFPAAKSQMYGATRPAYRPPVRPSRRRGRGCCCSLCLWLTFFILAILLLAAIAGALFWVLYRPHRPDFSVAALRISQFNLSSPSRINFSANLTLNANNPNKKIQFNYDPMAVAVQSRGASIAGGVVPAFTQEPKNATVLKVAISGSGLDLDAGSVSSVKSDLKGKSGAPLTIQVDTGVRVKVGAVVTRKVGIRVSCEGVRATAPSGKSASTASTSDATCKIDLRVKFWKWTF